MATVYPGAIDGALTLANNKTDDTITAGDHAPLHNNISDAIIAIETTIGVNPSGSYGSIASALLDTIFKTPTVNQVVRATGDVVGLAVRASAAQNTANVFEMRLANNAVAAYINKTGAFNAAGLLVGGSPLNSGHLFDSASLARLASPAFTGTPTAPTPAGGDNSTKIATTAFVTAALSGGVPAGVIMPFAGDVAPAGYALCQGQLVDGTSPTYSGVWALVGLRFGGSGQASFRLPDLQGRAVFGLSGGSGHIDVRTIGNNENVGIASRRPRHNSSRNGGVSKTGTVTKSGGAFRSGGLSLSSGQSVIVGANLVGGFSFAGGATAWTNGNIQGVSVGISDGITVGDNISVNDGIGISDTLSIGPQTGAEPVDTVPYLVLNYIIKL